METLAPDDVAALTGALRRLMTTAGTPADLDAGLTELGWPDLLTTYPGAAVPLVFRLLGETGAVAPVLNDVVLHAAGRPLGGTTPLPFAGGAWVVWGRADAGAHEGLDPAIPLTRVASGPVPGPVPVSVPVDAGRRALGWWLVGTCRRMLALARDHALARTQFGVPVASFQAVRHRLAEAFVAVEGAEATLLAAGTDPLGSLLSKAAAGRAALVTARHCQQVLAGIGFTAEHEFQSHVRRTLTLDALLGSAGELTREAGTHLTTTGTAPRLADL